MESVSSSTKRERKSKEERRKKFRLDSRRHGVDTMNGL